MEKKIKKDCWWSFDRACWSNDEEELLQLSCNNSNIIREQVAANLAATDKVLRSLATTKDYEVLYAVRRHPKCTDEILKIIEDTFCILDNEETEI